MENTKNNKFISLLRKKGVSLSPKEYFVTAMSAMALGLFASLLMSTIFGTVANQLLKNLSAENIVKEFFTKLADIGKAATGAVIGVAIAHALKAPMLVMLSGGVIGLLANDYGTTFEGIKNPVTAGPLGAFVCVLLAVEIGKLVSKTTKVDILVTPFVTLTAGGIFAMLLCPGISYAMYWTGYFIDYATTVAPFLMGIIISVVVGIILTLPISSAAICAMINIGGIAGGAAVAGCCAQMIGFAVISFRENKWDGLVAQGLGTSMLQMGNIVKNPLIWIPATLASAITGPLSTCLFKLECTGINAGMGTCGLVGPIGVFTDMGVNAGSIVGVVFICFVLPAALSLAFSEIMRKLGYIKENDLKLDL